MNIRKNIDSIIKMFCLLALSFVLFSCNSTDEKIAYIKYQYYPDGSIKEFYYYLNNNDIEVKHGERLYFVNKKLKTKEHYIHGKLNGLIEHLSPTYKQHYFFENGKKLWLKTYNQDNKQISYCEYKNNLPYDGSIWIKMRVKITGKRSDLTYYKNGKIYKKVLCDKDGKPITQK